MDMKRFFTSESVTEGHPDKMCDKIADAILDEYIKQDPSARVACEVIATTGMVLVMGEITANAHVDVTGIVRNTIKDIGYVGDGFDYRTTSVIVALDGQSPDIAMGVDDSVESDTSSDPFDKIGAGDQGLMFGFACTETEELMPLPIMLSHKMMRKLTEVRKSGELDFLRPDGKGQVTVEYNEDGSVKRIEAVVLSTQHSDSVDIETLRKEVKAKVIDKVIPADLVDENTKYFINPTGRFVIGGPQGDSGLTGRKIIVDTYGGHAPHGGGSFSGKDPTKVDRSATYYARYAAKNVVAAGLAEKCELQIAYAIGVAHPVSIAVHTFGTNKVPEDKIAEALMKVFDFRPAAIIDQLKLRRPIYSTSAAYGHFGRSEFPWEQTDRAEALKRLF